MPSAERSTTGLPQYGQRIVLMPGIPTKGLLLFFFKILTSLSVVYIHPRMDVQKSRKTPKTTYRVKVAEIVVSHQPIDSVIIGCLPAIQFIACAVWIGGTRLSVTAPYPSGYVLAAGRLRPRRKPERKLIYTERVP